MDRPLAESNGHQMWMLFPGGAFLVAIVIAVSGLSFGPTRFSIRAQDFVIAIGLLIVGVGLLMIMDGAWKVRVFPDRLDTYDGMGRRCLCKWSDVTRVVYLPIGFRIGFWWLMVPRSNTFTAPYVANFLKNQNEIEHAIISAVGLDHPLSKAIQKHRARC